MSAQLNLAAYEFNSSDEEIKTKLYNAANRPFAERLTGHGDSVGSVAFSPDGEILATGSIRTMQLQNLDVAQVVERICDATKDYIAPDVWQKYFPGDAPIESPCSDS